jgi:hypothetical protein
MKRSDDKRFSPTGKEKEGRKARRSFLKKAAYSAPSLLILGQLSKPEPAHADASGGPPPPPGGGGWQPG